MKKDTTASKKIIDERDIDGPMMLGRPMEIKERTMVENWFANRKAAKKPKTLLQKISG